MESAWSLLVAWRLIGTRPSATIVIPSCGRRVPFMPQHKVVKLISPCCCIYASVNWINIGSGNGLPPVWRQAITWANAALLSNAPLETNFSEIRIKIHYFHWWKCIWKDRLRNGGHYVQEEITLKWRNNGCDGASNHQPHDCLLNRLFRRRSKKTPNPRVTGLCAGNSPGTGEFPA